MCYQVECSKCKKKTWRGCGLHVESVMKDVPPEERSPGNASRMCFKAQCPKCNKTTWKGCGKHVEAVMKDVPPEERCACPREDGPPTQK